MSAISQVLATPTPPPSSAVCCTPRSRHEPHAGPRGRTGRGGERAYPPRRPLRPQSRRRRSVPAGPSFARAPGPGKKGGGPESGRAFPIPHPTGTSLPHITNSFLSHFLAGGGVSWAPPGAGPAPSPGARPPPPAAGGSLPPAPPSACSPPRPRPLARSCSKPAGSRLRALLSFPIAPRSCCSGMRNHFMERWR